MYQHTVSSAWWIIPPHATSHPALAGIDVDGFTGVLLFQDFAWNQKL
jgi:hypothetical protein